MMLKLIVNIKVVMMITIIIASTVFLKTTAASIAGLFTNKSALIEMADIIILV